MNKLLATIAIASATVLVVASVTFAFRTKPLSSKHEHDQNTLDSSRDMIKRKMQISCGNNRATLITERVNITSVGYRIVLKDRTLYIPSVCTIVEERG